jgi:serine/threonine-protein kinase RsbT
MFGPRRRRTQLPVQEGTLASDSGQGIDDVTLVMDNGYRSRAGMGMGLKGTKHLMDHLEIATHPGVGTTVTARKFLP